MNATKPILPGGLHGTRQLDTQQQPPAFPLGTAPPVYRSAPLVSQSKPSSAVGSVPRSAKSPAYCTALPVSRTVPGSRVSAGPRPAAPTVYRPQSVTSQAKLNSNPSFAPRLSSPPVYRAASLVSQTRLGSATESDARLRTPLAALNPASVAGGLLNRAQIPPIQVPAHIQRSIDPLKTGRPFAPSQASASAQANGTPRSVLQGKPQPMGGASTSRAEVIQRWGIWDTIGWAKDKLWQAPDLALSSRRQLMLGSSTLARQVATSRGFQYVDVSQIQLFHPTTTTLGSKTHQRMLAVKAILNRRQRNRNKRHRVGPVRISAAEIDQAIPSQDRIQVAESADNYITLQGVGRLCAVKLAALSIAATVPGFSAEVEVETFDVGRLFNTLQWVSTQWYGVSPTGDETIAEGYGWKALGFMITTALGATAYSSGALSLAGTALSTGVSGIASLSSSAYT